MSEKCRPGDGVQHAGAKGGKDQKQDIGHVAGSGSGGGPSSSRPPRMETSPAGSPEGFLPPPPGKGNRASAGHQKWQGTGEGDGGKGEVVNKGNHTWIIAGI